MVHPNVPDRLHHRVNRVAQSRHAAPTSKSAPVIHPEERIRVSSEHSTTEDGGTGFGLNTVEEPVGAPGWNVRVTDGVTIGALSERIESIASSVRWLRRFNRPKRGT